ncbi:alpha/beta hydrolase [Lacticigenium naphthae]|uniref:alpha/beta hydrolase n=1 Tax=Lacticigenium naphthae TaxID=515351 RepID=UPI000406585E|nr:alpha/beta hydrolase [Lacticigenium naphthae]
MTKFQPTIFSYDTIQEKDIPLFFFPAKNNRKNKTLIYLHGGGLIYGEANDLSDVYIEKILAAGFDLITLAYPLAPEVKIETIVSSVITGIEWFQKNYEKKLNLSDNGFVLFGRSSGAYLSLLATSKLRFKPEALILFYGYYSLKEASFHVPSRYYLTHTLVKEETVNKLIEKNPRVNGSKNIRYSIYVHYRQKGTWIKNIMDPTSELTDYSLSKEQLKEMPPSFIVASRNDPEIPFSLSKKMNNLIPLSRLEEIDSTLHDFDRVDIIGKGSQTYDRFINWLCDGSY